MRLLRTIVVAALLVWAGVWGAGRLRASSAQLPPPRMRADAHLASDAADGILVGTFLGGPQRHYYGKGPVPGRLDLIWKTPIGSGWTNRKVDNKPVVWAGAGWTGQPTLVRDGGKLALLLNGYDHKLHRYDAATGDTTWEYSFDDVVKATNTVFVNPHPSDENDRLIVTDGSRRGFDKKLGDPSISGYRAVAFGNGRELWRMPIPRTANYSQDVDASGLMLGGALYQAVEPGYVYKLDPTRTKPWGRYRKPVVLARSRLLWDKADVAAHGGEPGGSNLCIEGSPAAFGDLLYVSTGSGHIYVLRQRDLKVVWDFRIGCDIVSTPAVREDGKMLVGTKREYVDHGGAFLLDPSKPPKSAAVWWFPTKDQGIGEWNGGVVGSVAINDTYDADGTRPALAAFNSVDGSLYVVSQDETDGVAAGPHSEPYPKPKLVFSQDIGASISTPVIVGDRIVTGGYDSKVHVFQIDYATRAPKGAAGTWLTSRQGRKLFTSVHEVASFATGAGIEATPLVWKGRVYIASRDGYLYCLGDKRQTAVEQD